MEVLRFLALPDDKLVTFQVNGTTVFPSPDPSLIPVTIKAINDLVLLISVMGIASK